MCVCMCVFLLICSALRLAGRRNDADALYTRMSEGLKGEAARPDPQSAQELFKAMNDRADPDVQGMLRYG